MSAVSTSSREVPATSRPARRKCKARKRPQKQFDKAQKLCDSYEDPPTMADEGHHFAFFPARPSAAHAIRRQIRTAFCDGFIPPSEQYAYMYAIFDIGGTANRGSETACTVAADALCVLQLGTTSRSKRLIIGYYELCVKAVQRLRAEVTRLRDGLTQDTGSVVAAIYFLGICESYAHTRYDSRGFMEHMKGLETLTQFDQSPPESRLSEEAATCFEHWRYVQALGYGLVARKAAHAQPPLWDVTMSGAGLPVTELALQVPACLEELEGSSRRAEKCPEDEVIASEADATLQRALALRQGMNDCLERWIRKAEMPPYLKVDVDEFPELPTKLGDLVDVFPNVLRFSDLPVAKTYRTYWLALLALDQAILETCRTLLDLPDFCIDVLDDRDLANLRHAAAATATLLAQSLPYLCSSWWNSSGSYGVLLPLHFLERYFEWTGYDDRKQLAWCRRLKESVVLGYKIKRIMEASS